MNHNDAEITSKITMLKNDVDEIYRAQWYLEGALEHPKGGALEEINDMVAYRNRVLLAASQTISTLLAYTQGEK